MKKHPIDELFAKKLAEHRQEPSQKAFEKFQARLQEKQTRRRGGVFAFTRNWGYYAAAAGVVAALTIGMLSQRNTEDAQVAVNAGKPDKVGTVAGQPASPSIQGSTDIVARNKIEAEKALNTYNTYKETRPVQDVAAVKETQVRATNAPVGNVIPAPVPEESNVAVASNYQTEDVQTLTGKNATAIETFNGNNTDIASKYSIGRESVVLIIAPVEESGVQATAETEASIAEKAEKEKSFLAKLYGEYKHFKYGEKVDLKGLGVKDAVARVDENLFKEEREDVRDFVQRRIGRMQRKE